MPPKFSIIIPAYNAEKTIAQTIRAALSQDTAEPFEVIVVDDGSTDQTARVVALFPEVKYLFQPNAGPASARNAGVKMARGEFVFFTDSDCIPHPDWAQKILPHFADPRVAAVAGSYSLANPAQGLAVCIHREILFRHNKLLPQYPKVFGSYNVALRRSVLDEVFGYSARYRHASGEDNDLSYRIIKAGYLICFEPLALVAHHHTTSVAQYLREQFRHGFWRARMYLDHPGMSRGDDYTFWKDAVEVPLTLFIFLDVLFFPLCASVPQCPSAPGAGLLGLWAAGALLFLETLFTFRNIGFSRRAPFWAGVMSLRAFSRTLGFMTGAATFLPQKLLSKTRHR